MKRKTSLLLCIAILLSVLSACNSDSAKVSDSQIELDMPDLLEYLDDEEGFPLSEYFDHWETVQHTCNEETHTDTVQLNLYYSPDDCDDWLVNYYLYTVNLVYRYSRDNDLWSLRGNNGAEYIETEYQPDLADKLEGMAARAEKKDYNYIYDDTAFVAGAWIVSVDSAAGTMVIDYIIYQDGETICDARETFDFEDVFFYWGFYIHFNYTLTDSRGYNEPRIEDGYLSIKITEDSMDLSIGGLY